jgi:2-polyprenyl-6-methoxyphenol hydroxylase-like FAD-dependent oxidoreductase
MPVVKVSARTFARCAPDRESAPTICDIDFQGGVLNWGVLWRYLRRGVPDEQYWMGCEAIALDTLDNSGVKILCGRRTVDADIVIGADGYRSRVRRWMGETAHPASAGYVLWRGTVPEADVAEHARHIDAARPLTIGHRRGHTALYLIPTGDAGIEPGRRLVNWAVYDYVPATHLRSLFGGDDRGALRSIAPGQASREQRAYLASLAAHELPRFLEGIIAATAEPFCQPIHDLTATHYAAGAAALVGDAGTVARPHAGAGVGKALDDAFALVDALSADADPHAALVAYDAERTRVGNAHVAFSRQLGQILVERPPNWQQISGAELESALALPTSASWTQAR